MNDLAIFYLMTSAIHVMPFLFITLSLVYGDPILWLREFIPDLPRLNRRLRNISFIRWGQGFQVFDSETSEYFLKFSLLVSGLQVIAVAFIIMVINYDIPLPYIGTLNGILPTGIVYDLLKFLITTSLIQMLPLYLLFLAVLCDIPLPFMPSPRQNLPPSRNQIITGEQLSQNFASIRLTRFETFDKTYIFARCRNDNLATGFKLVFCQRSGDPRTQCYLYLDDVPTLQQVIPSPVSVNELEDMFNNDDE